MEKKLAIIIGVVLTVITFLALLPVINNQVDDITERSNIYNVDFTSQTEASNFQTQDFLEWINYHFENGMDNIDVYIGSQDVITYEAFIYTGNKFVLALDTTSTLGVYTSEIIRFNTSDNTYTLDYGDNYTISYPITISFVAYYS